MHELGHGNGSDDEQQRKPKCATSKLTLRVVIECMSVLMGIEAMTSNKESQNAQCPS
jgi:hypothetical protein